jgi:hypothetical protein
VYVQYNLLTKNWQYAEDGKVNQFVFYKVGLNQGCIQKISFLDCLDVHYKFLWLARGDVVWGSDMYKISTIGNRKDKSWKTDAIVETLSLNSMNDPLFA